ncbi:MAG TPA: CDP-alcohol phosphatidyltransferase family protein [Acidobacteriota bacterium]|jgi:phosphatidylglycerophosphate synthase
MPSVYDLKPRFQNLLRPLMRYLARRGCTPNEVTGIAVMGSILAGLGVLQAGRWSPLLLLLPLWLFARMALNAIDGMMARELHMASNLGAVLNELGDVLSDLGLYLPLAFLYPRAGWPVVAFSFGAVLAEFSGVLGRALGAARHYEGPMGKSDRAFLVGALCLVTFAVPAAFVVWPWVFSAGALLALITCWNRVSRALAELASALAQNSKDD